LKIKLIQIGKTEEDYLKIGTDKYLTRLQKYLPTEVITLAALKNVKSVPIDQQKEMEGCLLLDKFEATDYVVLLDEKGREMTSVDLAGFIQNQMNTSIKCLCFVIGGPYGFSPKVYQRAQMKLSLSQMTFSHQMIRLLFLEQCYRAFTILRNEPYHHL